MKMKKILIVEDNKEIAELWDEVMRDEGYSTAIAYDGEEAMERLREEKYDVIVLDLMLPGADGFDVLEFMQVESIETPVLAVTGEVIEDARRRVFSYPQVREFLFKPILPSQLIKEIERHTE